MPVLAHQQNRAVGKNRKKNHGTAVRDNIARDANAAWLGDAILAHAEHTAFINRFGVENSDSAIRHPCSRFFGDAKPQRGRSPGVPLLSDETQRASLIRPKRVTREDDPPRGVNSTECGTEMPDG